LQVTDYNSKEVVTGEKLEIPTGVALVRYKFQIVQDRKVFADDE